MNDENVDVVGADDALNVSVEVVDDVVTLLDVSVEAIPDDNVVE